MQNVYKTVVIHDQGKLALSGLPYKKGQRVEVSVRPALDRKKLVAQLRKLFKITQALSQAKTITDDDIMAEIAAYRSGTCES